MLSVIGRNMMALTCLSLLLYSGNPPLADESVTQPAGAQATDPHARHRAMLKKQHTGEAATADIAFLDKPLLTRNGDTVLFASDAIGERIAVIDFVYTTCTTVCPALSAIFQQVQGRLGDRLGDDVRLISVSVDPVRDTPQRMKAYADRLHARPDWLWLTGEKTTVDEVLRALGAYSPNFEDHPAIVLVGDPQSGVWKRFFGFPSTGKIMTLVDELTAARQQESSRP